MKTTLILIVAFVVCSAAAYAVQPQLMYGGPNSISGGNPSGGGGSSIPECTLPAVLPCVLVI